MGRDYQPDEFTDSRNIVDNLCERDRNRAETGSESRREHGPRSDGQNEARRSPHSERNQEATRAPDPRKTYQLRDKAYRLRASEIDTMTELGKFRAVASKDLEKFRYGGDKGRAKTDVQNLIQQGLVTEKTIPHKEEQPRRLLTLTKRGRDVLRSTGTVPQGQAMHYGFTKPREAHHDADLYRLYQRAAERIEREGGKNPRVILDFELKKRLYHDMAKLGPDRQSAERKGEVAERHGLKVVRGKIPIPDLRIEYDTPDGERRRVDLELATEHYRARSLTEKVRAGFGLYARTQDAPGLKRVLDQRELTAEILSL